MFMSIDSSVACRIRATIYFPSNIEMSGRSVQRNGPTVTWRIELLLLFHYIIIAITGLTQNLPAEILSQLLYR